MEVRSEHAEYGPRDRLGQYRNRNTHLVGVGTYLGTHISTYLPTYLGTFESCPIRGLQGFDFKHDLCNAIVWEFSRPKVCTT